MWVARWCVSLLRVTDAMFAAVFEREAQVPQALVDGHRDGVTHLWADVAAQGQPAAFRMSL